MSCATVLIHQLTKKEKCQSSFVDFILEIDISGYRLERILFAGAGTLARRWWLWCGASLVVFGIATSIAVAAMTECRGSRLWEIAGDSAFVLSCAASSFAFLVLFVRFAGGRNQVDGSLIESACGICLVHYALASGLLLSLPNAPLSTIGKGSLVFVGASSLSWGTAAVLRRIHRNRISQWTS